MISLINLKELNSATGQSCLSRPPLLLHFQEDTFILEAVDVGVLQRVLLSLESDEQDDAWLPEILTISATNSPKKYELPCNMWIGMTANASQEKELLVDGECLGCSK